MNQMSGEGVWHLIMRRPISAFWVLCSALGVLLFIAWALETSNSPPYIVGLRPNFSIYDALARLAACAIPLVILAVSNIVRRWWNQRSAKQEVAKKETIVELRTRPSYSEAVRTFVAQAQSRVYLSIHTLTAATQDNAVDDLQRLMAERCEQGCDIRILAPSGADRVEAAFELKNKGIPTRHLSFLDDDDLRFTIIDRDTTIISTRVDAHEGATSEALQISSHRLNGVLAAYFDSNWNDKSALDFPELLRSEVIKLSDPSQPTSAKALAARLNISEAEVRKAMAEPSEEPIPLILLFGRPGSGKTTGARLVHSLALKAGCPVAIETISDYRLLHEWSRSAQHADSFEVASSDGFRVKDFGVLDVAIDQTISRVLQRSDRLQIVEFARNEYTPIVEEFQSLRRPVLIVYFDASLDKCMERNRSREGINLAPDSGLVPEDVMLSYYKTDDVELLKRTFASLTIVVNNDRDDMASLSLQLSNQVISTLSNLWTRR